MTKPASQQPVKEFRAGGISAAVWRNETADGDRALARHSVRIQKRYRDPKTGEWKNSDYFFTNDLPRLATVVRKAYEFIILRDSPDAPEPDASDNGNNVGTKEA